MGPLLRRGPVFFLHPEGVYPPSGGTPLRGVIRFANYWLRSDKLRYAFLALRAL